MVLYQKKHNHKQHYKFDKNIEKKIVYTSHHQIQDLWFGIIHMVIMRIRGLSYTHYLKMVDRISHHSEIREYSFEA